MSPAFIELLFLNPPTDGKKNEASALTLARLRHIKCAVRPTAVVVLVVVVLYPLVLIVVFVFLAARE